MAARIHRGPLLQNARGSRCGLATRIAYGILKGDYVIILANTVGVPLSQLFFFSYGGIVARLATADKIRKNGGVRFDGSSREPAAGRTCWKGLGSCDVKKR
jgi:hypothetical protein